MNKKFYIFVFTIVLFSLSFPHDKTQKSKFSSPYFRSHREKSSRSAVRPPFDWPLSTPEVQGLDFGIFENAIREVMKMPYVYSLLVIKNGFLINEWYNTHQDKDDSNCIASVSKSILSALIGIALKEKYLTSQDERMMDFFPEYVTSNIDPRKFDITLRHLLMLRAGYPNDIDWDIWRSNESWIKFAMELPLEADPGETWAYSSASTHLLSVILAKATGISTLEFAEQYLFEPLNISIRDWKQDPEGYYIGGWEMYFTPRDLARFGYLYLNSGFIDGIQIVPSDWIEKSLKDYSLTNINLGAFRDITYGYLWYHANVFDYDVYFCQGSGGQSIFIIPELNMVIVVTADSGSGTSGNTYPIFQLIAYHMLSPIKCLLGRPPYFPSKVSGVKVKNQGLVYFEYLNVLKWMPNPRNSGVYVSKYRIYQIMSADSWLLLDEVDANTFEYRDFGVEEEVIYTYGVSSVTDDGRESIAAIVSIQKLIN